MHELMQLLLGKDDYPRQVVGPRQSGRTTALAADAVHVAIHHPSSSILMVVPNRPTAIWLQQRVDAFLTSLGLPVSRGSIGITIPNNSRIMILTEGQVQMSTRGHNVTDLYLDNVDYFKRPRETFNACLVCMMKQPEPYRITTSSENL